MAGRWGASPEEWDRCKRLAKEDLLPAVGNPFAKKSERSLMRELGKTPSLYVGPADKRVVIGYTDWPQVRTTVKQIELWREEPDYSICIQTRHARALDLDVPDKPLSDEIKAAFLEELDLFDHLPTRFRQGTGKQLLAFIIEGEMEKRSFVVKEWQEWDEKKGKDVTKRWIVEFLANGQQFIACGTHPSGTRYEWEGGLPAKFPTIPREAFDRAWEAIRDRFALPDTERRAGRRDPTLAEDIDVDDPVAEHLLESGWQTYDARGGMLYLECPWADSHSSDNGETQTAWLLAGTGGYRNGHFRCLHEGCRKHSPQEFLDAVSFKPIKAEAFEDLTTPEERVLAKAYTAIAPGVSPKAKELAASLKLPLPGFNRDNRDQIQTSLENICRALRAAQAAKAHLAFDDFRGEMVLSDDGANWRSMVDADAVQLRVTLEALGFKERIGKEMMRDALELVGRDRRMDLGSTWINEVVPAWDGVARIAHLLPRYFKTEDTPYTRAVGEYVMTAHAGRVLDPGCKADMVPVLVGPQGVRKSSGIAALSPSPEFFSEFDLEGKDDDKARRMRGCLVGELAELRGLQTRDRESILAWIVRRHEEWTPKYKEYKVKLPRRVVFWGSTNDDEFLNDPTGERRWLPVAVLGLVDVDAIARDRLQLWAEAREAYLEYGVLYARAEQLARAEHAKFKVVDPSEPRIAAWLDEPWDIDTGETPRTCGRLLVNDVLTECLGIPNEKVTKRDQMRVGEILRKLGMEKVHKRVTTSAKRGGHTGKMGDAKVWIDASNEGGCDHLVTTYKGQVVT